MGPVGETRVDLLHLLEDLRDAYPGAAEETILTEIVANASDSGATGLTFIADPAQGALTIVDDGAGMRRRDLARYHDVAASTKERGAGIGFAGVGIKIALLICAEVVTETRRGKHHVASSWRLASRNRAPWRWVPPEGRVAERLPEEVRGVAVSTFGKVIRRGWDWLALAPAAADRVAGLIEVPALAESLTLNKADFIRAGARGAIYLAYRKAIQEAVAHQLSLWGDSSEPAERARRRAARPVERDLETVLADLADEFPLLAPLVEQRAGGQRRLPAALGAAGTLGRGVPQPAVYEVAAAVDAPSAAPTIESLADQAEPAPPAQPAAASGHLAAGAQTRRPIRYGLRIGFEARPDDPELGRLVESTVWVNEAHPAYRRAAASRSEGYHTALAVALALAPLAVDPAKEHAFINAFLASWGAAIERRKGRSRR